VAYISAKATGVSVMHTND